MKSNPFPFYVFLPFYSFQLEDVIRLEDESRHFDGFTNRLIDFLTYEPSFERLLQIIRRIGRLAQRQAGQRGNRRERVGNLALRLINEWRKRSSLLFVGEPPLSSKRSSL